MNVEVEAVVEAVVRELKDKMMVEVRPPADMCTCHGKMWSGYSAKDTGLQKSGIYPSQVSMSARRGYPLQDRKERFTVWLSWGLREGRPRRRCP